MVPRIPALANTKPAAIAITVNMDVSPAPLELETDSRTFLARPAEQFRIEASVRARMEKR